MSSTQERPQTGQCVTHPEQGKDDRPPPNTSDLFATKNLSAKFEKPYIFKGYGCQENAQHPLYRTTASVYGWFPPDYYTVPTIHFPSGQTFTNHLAACGMYRNYSLNTGMLEMAANCEL